MRISDWSSDVCSSDLRIGELSRGYATDRKGLLPSASRRRRDLESRDGIEEVTQARLIVGGKRGRAEHRDRRRDVLHPLLALLRGHDNFGRSEEHTSELQSIMRNSYAVFCLKKKKKTTTL